MSTYNPEFNSDLCQIKIDETETTKDWVETIELLFGNNRSSIIKANMNLNNENKIVILKLSINNSLYKEYLIGKYMSNKNTNFMNYTCYFQCNDNFKEYKNVNIKKYLCNGKGDELKILIMPFYKLGNFKDFFSNMQDNSILKSCTAQIMASYLFAYSKLGFLHNDCHLGNILIDTSIEDVFEYQIDTENLKIPVFGYKIIIMDYDTSIFDMDKTNSIMLIKDIFRITSEIIHKNEVDDLFRNMNIELNNLIKTKKYMEIINIINHLVDSIDI
jgi:hypothetical protein